MACFEEQTWGNLRDAPRQKTDSMLSSKINLVKRLLCFALALFPFSAQASFADPDHYLLDTLELAKVSDHDRWLLDSLLLQYHDTASDSMRFTILADLVDNLQAPAIWPRYNDLMVDQARFQIQRNRVAGRAIPLFLQRYLAVGLGNRGLVREERGDIAGAMESYHEALALAETAGLPEVVATQLNNLGVLHFYRGEVDLAIDLIEEGLRRREEIGDLSSLAVSYNNFAAILYRQGVLNVALKYFQKALTHYRKVDDRDGEASVLNNIGRLYGSMGELEQALNYARESLRIYREIGHKYGIGAGLNNIGLLLEKQQDLPGALARFQEAYAVNSETGNTPMVASTLSNLGRIYFQTGQLELAEVQFQRGLDLMQAAQDAFVSNSLLLGLARVALNRGNLPGARRYADRALAIAQRVGFPENVARTAHLRYEIELAAGNHAQALELYQLHVAMKDSMKSETNRKAAYKQEVNYHFTQQQLADSLEFAKEKEIIALSMREQDERLGRERILRIALVIGLLLLLVVLGGVALAYRQKMSANQAISEQKLAIEQEQQKSESLLLNILPVRTAAELKRNGYARPQTYEMVTVLFTDFEGFTGIAEQLSPEELVSEIDECFKAFDEIIERYPIEKIKTVGDAYMAAGGLPLTNVTNPEDVVRAALDIRDYMDRYAQQRQREGRIHFQVRIGVHTGPVVAGIVGTKKFAYDLWGDTVNTAARMEAAGEVGKVNISHTTFAHVADKFACQYRGKIEAKNKGRIDMYFLEHKSGRPWQHENAQRQARQ